MKSSIFLKAAIVLATQLAGCWPWHWPPHHGGSGGSGGGSGSGGSGATGGGGGSSGSGTCGPTDQFLLVTRLISGDCGPIYDEVVTPSDDGWTNPSFDNPCVVDGCHITCSRSFTSPTYDVTQELDLMLGDATVDNPMSIYEHNSGDGPYECESDYMVDVTRVPASAGAPRVLFARRGVSDPSSLNRN